MKQARLKQEVSRLQARNEWLPPGVSAVELRRQLAKGAMQHMDECVETCKTVLKGSMKVKNLTIEDQQLLSGAMVTLFATLSRPLRGNVCVSSPLLRRRKIAEYMQKAFIRENSTRRKKREKEEKIRPSAAQRKNWSAPCIHIHMLHIYTYER